MKPSRHVITSFFIGAALWFFTKSFYAGVICFASGVLVDFDHIIEYAIHHGWENLTLKRIYKATEETNKQEGEYKFTKVYLIFHIAEIAVLLWILVICTRNIYLLAVSLGYSSHLFLDWAGNPTRPFFTFMFWRFKNRFDGEKMFKEKM